MPSSDSEQTRSRCMYRLPSVKNKTAGKRNRAARVVPHVSLKTADEVQCNTASHSQRKVKRHDEDGDNPVMHCLWVSVEESATELISRVHHGNDETELVQALDAMTTDRLLTVVTHIARDGNTVLHEAAIRGRLLGLAAMLRNTVDVNSRNGGGYSPLYQCLCHNAMKSAQLLVNHGADVNETVSRLTGETLLHKMVKGDRTKAVELLIDSGASKNVTTKDGDTPLHSAARYNKLGMTQLLVRVGSDVNAVNCSKETPLHIAVTRKSFEVAKILVKNHCSLTAKDGLGMTALHTAVASSSLDLVRLMLTKNSTQINSKEALLGRTPLLLACSNSNQKMVSLLISHGADANLTTNYRKSGLHVAAVAGNNGALGAVIKFTTNINALSINNRTALHFAVSECHHDVVCALLSAGVNVNLKDIDGNSALHMAASNGDSGILTVLLQHGAQINATNMQQHTPLHIAFLQGNEETGWVLVKAGCDTDVLDMDQKRACDYLQQQQDDNVTPGHSPLPHDLDTSTENVSGANTQHRFVRFNEESQPDLTSKQGPDQNIHVHNDAQHQGATKNALAEYLHSRMDQEKGDCVTHPLRLTALCAPQTLGDQPSEILPDLPFDFATLQVDDDTASSTPIEVCHGRKLSGTYNFSPYHQDDNNRQTVFPCVDKSIDLTEPFQDKSQDDNLSDKGQDNHDIHHSRKSKHRQLKTNRTSKPLHKTNKVKSGKGKAVESHSHHGNHEHGHKHGGHEDHNCGRNRKVSLTALK